MTEFLKICLDSYTQPAEVRLSDITEYSSVAITQAHFSQNGAIIERLRSDKKARQYHLTPEEADAFCDAWMDYRGRVIQHAEEQEARKKEAVEHAFALASVRFDYEPLNIQISQDGYSESGYDPAWHVTVPAVHFNHYYDINSEKLPETVQAALDRIKEVVEEAERRHFAGTIPQTIIDSYRRVFPTEQGEPEEIVEARRLLTEAGFTGWIIEHVKGKDLWGFMHEKDILFVMQPAADALARVREYVTRVSKAIETNAGSEPEEIQQARKLLTEAGLTGWILTHCHSEPTADCWSFALDPDNQDSFALIDKPAAEMLAFVQEYLNILKQQTPEPIKTGD